MLNVIKMDLHRMFKSKSCYVILGIVSAVMILSMYFIHDELKSLLNENEQQTAVLEATENGSQDKEMNFRIYYNTASLPNENTTLLDIVYTVLSSGILLIFTGIYAVIFVCGENNSGFIKNTASCIKNRWYLVVSKTVTLAVFAFMEMVVVLSMIAIGSAIYMSNVSLAITVELLGYIGLQFLLHMAFIALVVMISVLLRSTAISMVISMLLCTGVERSIISFISKINIGGKQLFANISKYLITPNVEFLEANPTTELGIRVILISVITMIIYNVIGSILMEKRDI